MGRQICSIYNSCGTFQKNKRCLSTFQLRECVRVSERVRAVKSSDCCDELFLDSLASNQFASIRFHWPLPTLASALGDNLVTKVES